MDYYVRYLKEEKHVGESITEAFIDITKGTANLVFDGQNVTARTGRLFVSSKQLMLLIIFSTKAC